MFNLTDHSINNFNTPGMQGPRLDPNRLAVNNFNTPGMQGPRLNPNPPGPFDMDYKGSRGAARSGFAGMNARLGQSFMGRSLQQGTMESFGWHFEKGASQGFLGLKNESIKHSMSTVKGGLGLAGRTLTKSLGLLSTAYFAYEGYQNEGVWGAAKGIGESIAYSTAFAAASTVLGTAALPLAAVAAVGIGTYALAEAGIAHEKGLRELEMGGGDQMQNAVHSAGAATARQRSLMALNNTHINGRMSLGNEGFLMHRGFSG
jgi:hypothetical protein